MYKKRGCVEHRRLWKLQKDAMKHGRFMKVREEVYRQAVELDRQAAELELNEVVDAKLTRTKWCVPPVKLCKGLYREAVFALEEEEESDGSPRSVGDDGGEWDSCGICGVYKPFEYLSEEACMQQWGRFCEVTVQNSFRDGQAPGLSISFRDEDLYLN